MHEMRHDASQPEMAISASRPAAALAVAGRPDRSINSCDSSTGLCDNQEQRSETTKHRDKRKEGGRNQSVQPNPYVQMGQKGLKVHGQLVLGLNCTKERAIFKTKEAYFTHANTIAYGKTHFCTKPGKQRA